MTAESVPAVAPPPVRTSDVAAFLAALGASGSASLACTGGEVTGEALIVTPGTKRLAAAFEVTLRAGVMTRHARLWGPDGFPAAEVRKLVGPLLKAAGMRLAKVVAVADPVLAAVRAVAWARETRAHSMKFAAELVHVADDPRDKAASLVLASDGAVMAFVRVPRTAARAFKAGGGGSFDEVPPMGAPAFAKVLAAGGRGFFFSVDRDALAEVASWARVSGQETCEVSVRTAASGADELHVAGRGLHDDVAEFDIACDCVTVGGASIVRRRLDVRRLDLVARHLPKDAGAVAVRAPWAGAPWSIAAGELQVLLMEVT